MSTDNKDGTDVRSPPAQVDDKAPTRSSKPCLLERGISGRVSWYSLAKGFGFIERNDDEPDVFVHGSAIVRTDRFTRILSEGERVEFDVFQGARGPEAVAVTGKGGVVVRAHCYRGKDGILRVSYHNRAPFRRPVRKNDGDDHKEEASPDADKGKKNSEGKNA